MLKMNVQRDRGRAANCRRGLGREQNTRRQWAKIAKTRARKNRTECDTRRVKSEMCDTGTGTQQLVRQTNREKDSRELQEPNKNMRDGI